MDLISPLDAMFLANESREHPMHIGSLQLFDPPAGAGPDFTRSLYERVAAARQCAPSFRKRPGTVLGGISNLTWAYDDEVDLDYHLRRSALPRPARVRELLELTSRWHSSPLDRHRPLWEQHLIEGLDDGRFAVYTKVHHALIDGASAQRLLQRTLDTDPDATDLRVPWNLPRPEHHADEHAAIGGDSGGSVFGRAANALRDVGSIATTTKSRLQATVALRHLTLPFAAPRTMFNVPIGGARRCAAQSWSLHRIAAVKKAAKVSVNDVVLAMCAAALRAYLLEQNALPDTPLVAMVPVSLRSEEEADAGGNLVGAMLCGLATHLDDPGERLRMINASMRDGKGIFSELPREQALAVSALMASPLAMSNVPGFVSMTRPPFNIVISNVPGPREPMYWNGARLVGNYPLSIALDGQALNITLATNADMLDIGVVGCRRSVPHLQRILGHLETGLAELEKAFA